MLLDTAGMYFRAFYGAPTTMTAADGTVINAVRGTLDAMSSLILRRKPTRLVACWDDDWRPAFRVDLIPSYKAHRVADPVSGAEEVPDLLTVQVPILVDVLAAAGVLRLGVPGYEADDVIGAYAAQRAGGEDVVVVTGDRDLFQLVDDRAGVSVIYTGKGMRNLQDVDEAWVGSQYGIPGRRYADFAALRGDPSDGLPGVSGIGAKTAADLVSSYDSLADMLAAAEAPKSPLAPGVRKKLIEAREYIAVAPRVVGVALDVPLPEGDDRLALDRWDADALGDLARRWSLGPSIRRLEDAIRSASSH